MLSSKDTANTPFRLLDLPPEILDQILSNLPFNTLTTVSRVCKFLRDQADRDILWQPICADLGLPARGHGPAPFRRWKDFWAAHYPYWFIPKHKIWFSDKESHSSPHRGLLILARYDYRTGGIEGYRLLAEKKQDPPIIPWPYDTDAIVTTFHPTVRLYLDNPDIKLSSGAYESGTRLGKETALRRPNPTHPYGIYSRIFQAIAIPPASQAPSTQLWPPRILPAHARVRSSSIGNFKDDRHLPRRADQVCEYAFRIRRWMTFSQRSAHTAFRIGEDVATWATLPEDCYMPTAEKPWQGIWVGDYEGHGCEFVVIVQKLPQEQEDSLPHVVARPGPGDDGYVPGPPPDLGLITIDPDDEPFGDGDMMSDDEWTSTMAPGPQQPQDLTQELLALAEDDSEEEQEQQAAQPPDLTQELLTLAGDDSEEEQEREAAQMQVAEAAQQPDHDPGQASVQPLHQQPNHQPTPAPTQAAQPPFSHGQSSQGAGVVTATNYYGISPFDDEETKSQSSEAAFSVDPPGCSGRLEAIKLTGDVNVPRGEYSWVAKDIGSGGYLRTEKTGPFKGARIVESLGHLAGQNYTRGEFQGLRWPFWPYVGAH